MALGSGNQFATRGLSNLLIRRVMRHRNVATLFHGAPSEAVTVIPAALQPNAVIVTAVPIPFPDADATQLQVPLPITISPEEWVGPVARSAPVQLPSPLGTRRAVPTAGEQNLSTPSPSSSSAGAGQVVPTSRDGVPALPPISAPPIKLTQPVATTAEATRSAAPIPPSAPGVRQAFPASTDRSPTVARAVTSREIGGLPPSPLEARQAVLPLPAETSAKPPDTTITNEVWQRLRTIFQRHHEHEEASELKPASSPDGPPLSVPDRASNAVTTTPSPPDARDEAGDQVIAPHEQPDIDKSLIGPATMVEPTASVVDRPQLEMTQALPLQDVWDVQPVQARPAGSTQLGTTSAPSPQAKPETVQEPVRQVLDRIAPGGATRSTIEVLPPRQPRPRTQTSAIARAPVTLVPPASLTDRTAEPSLVQTAIGPLPADLWDLIGAPLTSGSLTSGSLTSGSPQASSLPSGLALDHPDVIAADQARTEHASSDDTSLAHTMVRDTSAERAVREDAARTEVTPVEATYSERVTAPAAPSGVTRPSRPGLIQRSLGPPASTTATIAATSAAPEAMPASVSGSAQATPATESSGGTVPGTGGGPDIDVAELARRVYVEIKRRLTVERERSRSSWH